MPGAGVGVADEAGAGVADEAGAGVAGEAVLAAGAALEGETSEATWPVTWRGNRLAPTTLTPKLITAQPEIRRRNFIASRFLPPRLWSPGLCPLP